MLVVHTVVSFRPRPLCPLIRFPRFQRSLCKIFTFDPTLCAKNRPIPMAVNARVFFVEMLRWLVLMIGFRWRDDWFWDRKR